MIPQTETEASEKIAKTVKRRRRESNEREEAVSSVIGSLKEDMPGGVTRKRSGNYGNESGSLKTRRRSV